MEDVITEGYLPAKLCNAVSCILVFQPGAGPASQLSQPMDYVLPRLIVPDAALSTSSHSVVSISVSTLLAAIRAACIEASLPPYRSFNLNIPNDVASFFTTSLPLSPFTQTLQLGTSRVLDFNPATFRSASQNVFQHLGPCHILVSQNDWQPFPHAGSLPLHAVLSPSQDSRSLEFAQRWEPVGLDIQRTFLLFLFSEEGPFSTSHSDHPCPSPYLMAGYNHPVQPDNPSNNASQPQPPPSPSELVTSDMDILTICLTLGITETTQEEARMHRSTSKSFLYLARQFTAMDLIMGAFDLPRGITVPGATLIKSSTRTFHPSGRVVSAVEVLDEFGWKPLYWSRRCQRFSWCRDVGSVKQWNTQLADIVFTDYTVRAQAKHIHLALQEIWQRDWEGSVHINSSNSLEISFSQRDFDAVYSGLLEILGSGKA
ncbi:hypothetical protein K474DRAFT_1680855 [Panus rudis PR-1116 ss-1]|nr:hypothetical protein K474DRAFT_1680855 [Panus rudis PR-1116 ss-1]